VTAKLMLLLALLPLVLAKVLLPLTLSEALVMSPVTALMPDSVPAAKVLLAAVIFWLLLKAKSATAEALPLATVALAVLTHVSSIATVLISRPEAVAPVSARLLVTVLAEAEALTMLPLSVRLELPEISPVLRETSPLVEPEATELAALCAELKPATMPVMLPMLRLVALLPLLTEPEAVRLLPLADSVDAALMSPVVILLLPTRTPLMTLPLSAWALARAKSALALTPAGPLASEASLTGWLALNMPLATTAKPLALVAVTLMVLEALLPLALALWMLLFKLKAESLTAAAVMPTDKADSKPALDVMVLPLVMYWLLPRPAFSPVALVALKVTPLPAELPVADDSKLLPLTLTWLASMARLGVAPDCVLKLALTLLPSLLDVKANPSFFWELRTDAANPDKATSLAPTAEGTKATALPPLPPTVRLLALRLRVDASTLPSAVAVMRLSLTLTVPLMVVVLPKVPTVAVCEEVFTLAVTPTAAFACVFAMAALATMLPMLADGPALMRLPAKLAVAVAAWVLPV